ncbi:hypothetical protein QEG73_18560 [Chitinophagaceae bacterium 26-R-25]|nr:hypothetical protein [Chitinophagaceae bacterium 26-R-25]
MLANGTRNKIKNITAGIIVEGCEDHCATIRNLLCTSFPTSTTVKEDFESKSIIKEKQIDFIEAFCDTNNFWATNSPGEDRYLTRGGEARVYLHPDNKNVIKLNDGVYYATWLEFFNGIFVT